MTGTDRHGDAYLTLLPARRLDTTVSNMDDLYDAPVPLTQRLRERAAALHGQAQAAAAAGDSGQAHVYQGTADLFAQIADRVDQRRQ